MPLAKWKLLLLVLRRRDAFLMCSTVLAGYVGEAGRSKRTSGVTYEITPLGLKRTSLRAKALSLCQGVI